MASMMNRFDVCLAFHNFPADLLGIYQEQHREYSSFFSINDGIFL